MIFLSDYPLLDRNSQVNFKSHFTPSPELHKKVFFWVPLVTNN